MMTREYALPGIWVREHTVPVPLDWSDPGSRPIEVFVRELSDPARRTEDLPLLLFLQGGPGGKGPRPVDRSGWIGEALRRFRVVLLDQRGTGRSTPVDGSDVTGLDAVAAADLLSHYRADSIVRDAEHVRRTLYDGRRWSTLGQSYGGFITLTYLSTAPDGLAACYVTGGIPAVPPDPRVVYAHTYDRLERKNAELYARYPHLVAEVAGIADVLEAEDVRLPDGDRLTVRRLQSLGIDLGMGPGPQRLHWLLTEAFRAPGVFQPAFLEQVQVRTASTDNPLFWVLQEFIYGDGANGPTGWAAQAERDRRPAFAEDARPLLLTGEMTYPWMFTEVKALRPFRPAVEELAAREVWSELYAPDRLAANDVPLAAAVYLEDMFVASALSLRTLDGIGNSRAWATNEFEHDGLQSGRVLSRLIELVEDDGGERR
ncbi:alpha/beta hydrolase [Georgenia sp. TF02-10]|uniref:alpha/beta fold hydrolase n=1 Tax=Georgenia sp. TF02-10 TaxID=2917725 RepID=UPI001FA727D4|nr:alpha/beta fold hydrolase [Georgenia sp. TF02-10]UNX55110.1 alpha/beta hydrolase [Georgenia sp. TF02-10]